MLKLLICLASATLLAAVILQLRQQRLELSYETAELHDQIRGQQSRLWDQQLRIASCTAPNAISQTINLKGLKLVPENESVSLASDTSDTPDHNIPSREPQP
jgi:cell division protein FtsL